MGKKSLAVYFSCRETIELAGKELVRALECDFHPPEAQEIYTREDLDWKNLQSWPSVEVRDEKAGPSYKKLPADLKDYEQTSLSFPTWWGIESRIIDHFIKQEDLKGKEVIPFAASGGNIIDKIRDRLEEKYGQNLTLLRGHRFSQNLKKQEIKDWLQISSH